MSLYETVYHLYTVYHHYIHIYMSLIFKDDQLLAYSISLILVVYHQRIITYDLKLVKSMQTCQFQPELIQNFRIDENWPFLDLVGLIKPYAIHFEERHFRP